MANISVTAASVKASAAATIVGGSAGASITAGQPVYQDVNGVWQLAGANIAASASALTGIALDAAAVGQPLLVCVADPSFTHGGAAVTTGEIVMVSATPGALCPSADATTGFYPVILGIAISATKMIVRPLAAGVVM